MRRFVLILLCVILAAGSVSCALAQSVPCPDAHLILTVPDSWILIPFPDTEDPDLRLHLEGDDISLSLYVADANGLMPDAFQVLVGDETESGDILVGDVEISYVAGESADGEYRIYTWVDRRNQVQMYFLITGRSKTARQTIEEIIQTLVFE